MSSTRAASSRARRSRPRGAPSASFSTPRRAGTRWRRAFLTISSARECSKSHSRPRTSSAPSEQLRANAIEFLPIPENYYDDLEARTDLDAAQIDRLRAGNILYERDGGGQYFPVSTRAQAGGYFCE